MKKKLKLYMKQRLSGWRSIS